MRVRDTQILINRWANPFPTRLVIIKQRKPNSKNKIHKKKSKSDFLAYIFREKMNRFLLAHAQYSVCSSSATLIKLHCTVIINIFRLNISVLHIDYFVLCQFFKNGKEDKCFSIFILILGGSYPFHSCKTFIVIYVI